MLDFFFFLSLFNCTSSGRLVNGKLRKCEEGNCSLKTCVPVLRNLDFLKQSACVCVHVRDAHGKDVNECFNLK